MAATSNQTVGVVIPAFNASGFIEDALMSVFQQTRAPNQVVVVDDCSADDTINAVRRLGIEPLIMSHNAGPASARNAAVEVMPTVDYIAFLDADDIWKPHHLETMLNGFVSSDVGVVFSETAPLEFSSDVNACDTICPYRPEDVLVRLLYQNMVAQSAVAVRRSDFLLVGGYADGLRYAEDYDLWIRLASITKFVHIETATCLRRTHKAQLSKSSSRLLKGALDARRRGVEFARAQHRMLPTEDLHRADLFFVTEALASAKYYADQSILLELKMAFEPSSAVGQVVRRWWRSQRWIWPFVWITAFLRRSAMVFGWRGPRRRHLQRWIGSLTSGDFLPRV